MQAEGEVGAGSRRAPLGQGPQKVYSGRDLLQIALPLGGIGAGCVCLNGYGGVQDFSIRGHPATSAMEDGHDTTDAAFALIHIRGDDQATRLLEGPFPAEKIYNQGLQGQGYRKGGYEGLPRFEDCTFRGEYPFGEVTLSDSKLPIGVRITGWNPFIPLDDKDSSIPCAIVEYTFENHSEETVEFAFSYHLSHLAVGSRGWRGTRNEAIPDTGIYFSNTEHPNHATFGSAALAVIGGRAVVKATWFRGGWFDSVSALWREVSTDSFTARDSPGDLAHDGRNGGSVMLPISLAAGEKVTYAISISWYFPNRHDSIGGLNACGVGCGCGTPDSAPKWRPYYASQWRDAKDVAAYVLQHYASLRARTVAFKEALFSSTLPPYVLDAVSANLAILKSPTVLRQENGNVWGWEGCFSDRGCCPGTCTHVWNYAQALPNLFPQLERTLREQEFVRSIDDRGHIQFRAALPDGPTPHDRRAAADGQLGGILKLYRDWHISGDRAWLKSLYPSARRSLDFCIDIWDPDRKGGLVEPHHNTYDIEFWGPDGMCTSIYVSALAAMAAMAHYLGKAEDAALYQELAARGAAYMDGELFNGEYFEQKVQWEGLRDTSFQEMITRGDGEDEQTLSLLRAEGPKYQYGSGCLSDGVIGAWMAAIYGAETPQNRVNTRKHLQAVFRHNFKPDLSEHACPQRPGYAMGHESGLLLCSWPRGGKPTLPFVYSDEVWTGIEYQVASHLIEEGLVNEGLAIVEAVRRRYDGRVRNPWNEYECGNYYARAMASYALIGSLSGFRYSAAERTLWFAPKLPGGRFETFFSTASGFGTLRLDGSGLTIEMIEGELVVDTLHLLRGGKSKAFSWGIVARAGQHPVKLLDTES